MAKDLGVAAKAKKNAFPAHSHFTKSVHWSKRRELRFIAGRGDDFNLKRVHGGLTPLPKASALAMLADPKWLVVDVTRHVVEFRRPDLGDIYHFQLARSDDLSVHRSYSFIGPDYAQAREDYLAEERRRREAAAPGGPS